MTLWTPDGERPVTKTPAPQETPATGGLADGPPLTPEQEQQAEVMAKELAEARVRIMETDASTIIGNHAVGIYELAAIHLTADDPKFDQVQLAVDALSALVEGLEGRLGEAEPTLKDALHQVRMGFVERKKQDATGDTP